MSNREVMQQALEALEFDGFTLEDETHRLLHTKAITALRKALEQQAEPVAWMYSDDYERMTTSETFCTVFSVKVGSPDKGVTDIQLYTTPPQRQWVGLEIEEVQDSYNSNYQAQTRAVEKLLKERNT